MRRGGCEPKRVMSSISTFSRLREWARALKRDVLALLSAARDPRTPWHAKALAAFVAAYALSPIDLIPDFIPVIGHLDDLIIVPAGIWLCLRLIPPEVMAEHRAAVAARPPGQRPVSYPAAAAIIAIWLIAIFAVLHWLALLPSP